ncbi:transposon ty2-lr2 Gag-Pol polyprotein [Plakobranchus ocellatus]|uniref:Transposon ty2-lr2 Gag-Pol polyprotein n=1 Tax=Plakobranchus ocellatus TaxID=259542 RepID=A0AAV4BVR1_9GAST|nr:transposon ty2-lr2 Gag-Pol polyprotein [Plakobranchus ocellatus]
MRVRNLHSVFKDLSNQDTPVDANKNEEAYAELVQVLDDRSLSLIIRDARDDGRKALQILRNHYRPTGKPRVITLYTELTSLIKLKHESITDYIIRAETSAASLRDAGEKVSDSLLISMVLKGLPTDYQPFVTVITQKEEELTFQEFKVALRNHEDTEEISRQHMNSSSKPSSSAIMSYKHKSDSDDHFTFHISDSAYECDSAISDCDVAAKLLVDSGASCHIITDKDKHKIRHEMSAPYSQHQNGKAERVWRTLFEMARCLLTDSGLPKFLWSYAVLAAAYIRNRCIHTKIDCTPFQAVTGKKPNINKMQPFGVTCICLVQNPKKLDNRGVKGTFVGYDRRSPAYLVFFSDTREVRKIRCVKFNATQPEKTDSVEIPIYEQTSPDEIQTPNPTVQVEEPHNQQSQSSQEASNSRGLGKRIKTRPKYLDDYVVTNDNDETESDENDFLNSTFLHY